MVMLESLSNHSDRDTLRLLACRLCLIPVIRRLLEASGATEFLDAAKLYADGQLNWDELGSAVRRAPQARVTGGSWRGHNPVRLSPTAQALRAVAELAAEDPWEAAAGVAREGINLLGPAACEVIRELFARPTT